MWIKRIFCKHDYDFSSTIHGDWIIRLNYNRSIWECTKCGKYIYRKVYVDETMKKNILRLKKIKHITNGY